MADGFGRVPVEAEVAAGDGEVGGDGQFFAGTRTEQGAVVADAEAEDGAEGLGCAAADLAEQSQFAAMAVAWQGIGPLQWHSLRIGQTTEIRDQKSGIRAQFRPTCLGLRW
jgi:hypothetical protein